MEVLQAKNLKKIYGSGNNAVHALDGVDLSVKKGEIMALENGKIVATGTDLVKMTYRLARSMKKKDTQFITVISGCDVSDEDAEKTTDLVRTKCGSSVEVSHISGGQPVYYYMISVE